MAKKSLYSPPHYFEREKTFRANVKERTGRTVEEWVAVVRRDGPSTEKERRAWLKDTHAFTTNYAWWLAELAGGSDPIADYDPEAYVETMFAGKEDLRPMFDALVKLGLGLGKDVKVCPCQTIVPLYRKHVFAQLRPTTRARLDLSFALGDAPFTERLVDTGGRAKKDRLTHRVGLARVADIDDEVKGWLQAAYDLDGVEKKREKKPEPVVPPDLAKALSADPKVRGGWEKLPPSHRREHVEAIEQAKKPQTRARRVERAVEAVRKKA